MRRLLAALGGLIVALAACSSADAPEGVVTGDGWSAVVVRDDLAGPTQLSREAGRGRVVVAELAGGEDEGRGRVLAFSPAGTGEPVLQAAELLTPTGVVAGSDAGGYVLVQEQSQLVRLGAAELTDLGVGLDSRVEVVDEGRPFNGRSQGTLTLLDDGTVLATASGRGSGPDVPAGSGVLYALADALAPDTAPTPVDVAVGFKNAYAHAIGPAGELYVTEISDGQYDGAAPPDELNVVPAEVWRAALTGTGEPYDGGWPRCTGDADPTEEFGATVEECEALPRPLALFPPRATPTSVVVTTAGRVLVALWVENRVVEVDPDTGEVTDVATGFDRPQHLLAMDDGSVLLTVHGSGELVRLTPTD